jgi:signal transduction histidine kinase/Flp pilus assembly protein TadD
MKSNIIVFLFLSLISFTACTKPASDLSVNPKTDSIIRMLQFAAYNNPDSALKASYILLDTQSSSSYETASILHLIASIYGLKGNYDSSIVICKRALPLAESNTTLLAKLYNEMGVSYDYTSDYRQAIDNYQTAQDYFAEAKDTIGFIQVRNNIGLIYQNSGDLKKAKTYFKDCLELSRKKKFRNEEIMALSNLAAVENEMKNYGLALQYFKEVLADDIASGNEAYVSYSYHNVGEAYKNLRQFDSSMYYLKKAIQLKEELELQAALINSYKGYADLLTEMNKLSDAEFYLDKAFALAKASGTTDYLKDCYYIQSRLAEKKGDYKTAYIAADSFYTMQDSLVNEKFRTELVIKEKDHEMALNEKLKQQEIKDLKNGKITFILFMTLFAGISIALFVLLKRQRKFNKTLKLHKQQVEEGLMLRTQLLSFVAHEIRNPLGGILGLTDMLLVEKPTTSQQELLLYQKKAAKHLLTLMNDVLDYQKLGSGKVDVSNVRFGLKEVFYQVYGLYQLDIRDKNLNYELNYDETIPEILMGDPIRLTQIFGNLLNNAIKFTDQGTISITAKCISRNNIEAEIFFEVKDSGVGIPKDDQEKIFELYVQSSKNKSAQLGTGLGLSIVKNLLSLMNSKMSLDSAVDSGTTFSFSIVFQLPQ